MEMSSHLARLASFVSWPSTAAVSSLALARSGFKYTGHGESTVCVECQLVIESWQSGDRPDQVHRQLSPNCPFVRSQLDASDSSILRTAVVEHSSHNVDIASTLHGLTVSDCVTRHANSATNLHSSAASDFPLSCTVNREHPDFERLKEEPVRLSTFHDWPERVEHIVKPRNLAKAGMFYTGQADRVQCAFCRGCLRNWVQGDDPAEEHRKNFPDCSFIRQQKDDHDGGNANLTANSVVDSPASASRDNPTQFQSAASQPQLSALGRPKHPYYASEQRRVESFTGAQVPRGQMVEVLAKAGFFHVGPDDNVRCYYCDGGLKNWQSTDEPWTEHRRWFARCPHLQATQSMPQIPTQNVPHDPASNYSAARQPPFISAVNHTNVHYRIEPREIKARLDAPIMQAVIQMGFHRNVVRKAIEQRLMATGDDFANAHSLLEAVLATEDGANAPTQTKNSQAASSAATAAVIADSLSMPTPPALPVNLATDVTSSAAAINVDVNNVATKSQHDAAPSALDITDETLPPKPKSKRKKKKNKSQAAMSDANLTDVNTNDASAAPTASVNSISSSVPTTEMLKENEKLREERTCKVCMDAEVNTVFLPCGHFVCCAECSQQLQSCPICRVCISGTVRASVS